MRVTQIELLQNGAARLYLEDGQRVVSTAPFWVQAESDTLMYIHNAESNETYHATGDINIMLPSGGSEDYSNMQDAAEALAPMLRAGGGSSGGGVTPEEVNYLIETHNNDEYAHPSAIYQHNNNTTAHADIRAIANRGAFFNNTSNLRQTQLGGTSEQSQWQVFEAFVTVDTLNSNTTTSSGSLPAGYNNIQLIDMRASYQSDDGSQVMDDGSRIELKFTSNVTPVRMTITGLYSQPLRNVTAYCRVLAYRQ